MVSSNFVIRWSYSNRGKDTPRMFKRETKEDIRSDRGINRCWLWKFLSLSLRCWMIIMNDENWDIHIAFVQTLISTTILYSIDVTWSSIIWYNFNLEFFAKEEIYNNYWRIYCYQKQTLTKLHWRRRIRRSVSYPISAIISRFIFRQGMKDSKHGWQGKRKNNDDIISRNFVEKFSLNLHS